MPSFKELLFISLICSAQLITQAGLAQGIAPQHIIGSSFHTTSPGALSWYAAAYSLTIGTFILFAGRLGDIFGHRLLFIIGFAWYGLWSVLAGVSVYSSENDIFFCVCRAVQGVGPALLLPNAIAILGTTYEPGFKKDMIFCVFGACAPWGYCVGSVFSALFAQLVWWPWGFWVMGIACFTGSALGYILIPTVEKDEKSEGAGDADVWKRLDIVGATTGITALILINIAWNQGAAIGWTVPYTYILLIIGILLLGAFSYLEIRATYPLLPRSALTGDLGWVLGCVSAGWSSFGIQCYYFYEFMEEIKNDSPLLTTAKWSGVCVSGGVAAITTGVLLGQLPPSVIMLMAMCAFTTGLCLMATVSVDQTYWIQAFLAVVITPWGMDMSFPSGTVILSNSMPREHQGLAASLVNTAVNYSISIGLGLAGTVESNVNNGGKDVLKGIRGAFYMGIGLAGLGTLIALSFTFVTWTRKSSS